MPHLKPTWGTLCNGEQLREAIMAIVHAGLLFLLMTGSVTPAERERSTNPAFHSGGAMAHCSVHESSGIGTRQKWRELVGRQRSSGLSVAAFCDRHGSRPVRCMPGEEAGAQAGVCGSAGSGAGDLAGRRRDRTSSRGGRRLLVRRATFDRELLAEVVATLEVFRAKWRRRRDALPKLSHLDTAASTRIWLAAQPATCAAALIVWPSWLPR